MSTPMNVAEGNQKKLILKAISGNVTLPGVSRMYVVGLLFTAAAVFLLPLLYLTLTALVAGSLLAFIRHLDQIFVDWNPVSKWMIISTIMFLGIAAILGLTKPFFAGSSAVSRPRPLRRDAEPLLFEYVDRLSDALGARRPTDIHITCDLNAAAEFRRGWLSLFSNREISLHLGLPLIAGLNLQQFTGVLAHELGHFTQRTAMWLENMVRRTNLWFFRATYERDAIDDWLLRQCTIGGPVAIPCYFARGIVWLTRRVLFALAYVGTIISCLMSREMEFNADLCQVRTVGSRTFGATMWRIRELSLAHQLSFKDVASFYDEGRLPDNMITLVVANTAFITPKLKKKLRQLMIDEKTGLFDSHPSDRDRIRASDADGSEGFFQCGTLPIDVPASVLFSRFDEISKAVTTRFYEAAFNQPIKAKSLHPVAKLLERQTVQIDAAKTLRRYFQIDVPQLRPLPIAAQSIEPPENPMEAAKNLKSCRDRMLKELPDYKRLAHRYRAADETLVAVIAAQTLLQAHLNFEPSQYRIREANAESIADKQKRAREGVANLAAKLLPFETEAGNRLSFSLQLLHVPGVIRRIPDGKDLQYEIKELLPEAMYVSRLIGELPTLRIVFVRLRSLWERLNGSQPPQRVLDMIIDQMTTLRCRLVSIQSEMGEHLYPFDHAKADTTLRAYALPQIPAEFDLGGLVQATEHMQSRLVSIQARLFARLACAAEKIEEAIGMPPLPEPEIEFVEFIE